MAPPMSSPPGEYSISISCIGDDSAKSIVAETTTVIPAVQILNVSKHVNTNDIVIITVTQSVVRSGVMRSLIRPL